MNEKIGKIKLELLKEEFIKQIKDSYTLNLSMVLLEEFENLQQENKILRENAENNDKVVDNVNWENMLLKKENKQLKDELKSKPDAKITLQDDNGNKFMVIQTERIDMQVELNKTIEKLFNNWNKLREFIVKEYYMYLPLEANTKSITILIDKMHELEGSDSNEI